MRCAPTAPLLWIEKTQRRPLLADARRAEPCRNFFSRLGGWISPRDLDQHPGGSLDGRSWPRGFFPRLDGLHPRALDDDPSSSAEVRLHVEAELAAALVDDLLELWWHLFRDLNSQIAATAAPRQAPVLQIGRAHV